MLLFTVLAIRLDGMGMPVLGAMGLFAALAAGLLIPYLRLRHPRSAGPGGQPLARPGRRGAPRRGPARASAPCGWTTPTSYPRPDFFSYVYDADTGRAAFEATDRDSWSRPLLRERASGPTSSSAPFATFSGWRAPAPALDLAGPAARAAGSHDRRDDDDAAHAPDALRAAPTRPRSHLRTPGPITAASVQGQTIAVNRTMREGRAQAAVRRAAAIPASSWSSASAATALPARPPGTTRRAFPRGWTCRRARPTRCPPP